ncbi:hypothetical protein BDB01DRAFT_893114 [Pilobolus umbonatus]|nr:hypothetical protein BDB01DRAFT_893114 [Pilobolus umbonatus]
MSKATFKSIILEKKRQVFGSRKANAFKIGSSSGKRRKQTYEDRAQKQQAKRQKDQVEGDVAICSKCKQRGHRSARSPLCPQGILSKAQVIRANLRDNYKAYTRKLRFDNCVSNTYHTKLKSNVIKACSSVRHLVFRAKLFVNYYVLENHNLIGAPKVIFSQNFWYSIIQMLLLGISECVAEACKELATSYTNNIVENFENHLLYFLRYKLQDLFRFMSKKITGEVAKKYCYQEICKGSPTWPNTELLNKKASGNQGIESLESEIPSPKTSKSSAYSDYVKYMLLNKDSFFGFYGKDTAKTRSQLYRGVQRATDQMAILIHGTSKKQKWKPAPYLESKTKTPLIVFGAGMFGNDAVKLKGRRCGVVGKLFRTLKRREAEGRLIVTTIDEFKNLKKLQPLPF